jgi:hypothetical protein
MKKTLLFSVLFITCYVANAQIGLQAGAGFYGGSAKSSGSTLKYRLKPGFTAGVVYGLHIGNNIRFIPSLNFTQKGGHYKESIEGESFEDKLTLNYLDLPLNFVYDAGGFFIGAGHQPWVLV